MSEATIKRNPFAAPGHVTLADVLARIDGDSSLPIVRRRNLLSSIRTFARLLGLDLSAMPAHPGYMRGMIKRFHPKQTNTSKKRWQNIKADITFALRHVGLTRLPGRYVAPLSPPWNELYQRLPDVPLKRGLSRFVRYCGANGIAPQEVDDTVADAFLEALVAKSFVARPEKVHQATCRLWNRAAEKVTGWPGTLLTVPDRRKTYTLPWSAFPQALRDEVDAWLARLLGEDPFAENAPSRPARPATIKAYRFKIRQIASALVHHGHEVEAITSLRYLVATENVKVALRFFLDRSGGTTTTQIYDMAATLKAIAAHWVGVDREHLKELKGICRRLNPGKRGLTDKNRERLRQFDDVRNKALLLDFPRHRLEEVRRSDKGGSRDALKVQTALAVELLLMIPVRVGNLAGLSIEHHFHWSRASRRGVVHLVIPADEVKNRHELEFELPAETVRLLEIYLCDYRPRLVDGPNEWLFPGRDGQHKRPAVLSGQIAKQVRNATGLVVNAHLFRHITAKLYLDSSPGGYEVVRRVLGHQSIDTTSTFYSGFETASAARHFDAAILKLRSDLAGRPEGEVQ